MKEKNNKCLVVNADYTPLSIISWKRAFVWSLKYQENHKYSIEIIDFYKDDYICGANSKKYPIPAVVKTRKYFRIHNQRVNFSRKNVFIRDDYTCQYCNAKKDIRELTYDHVIPKSVWSSSNGSPTNWTNIVTSCVTCNRKKSNRTPKQANMQLKQLPVIPDKSLKYLPLSSALNIIKPDIPVEWSIYLPESYS